jgi:hypothetical protein
MCSGFQIYEVMSFHQTHPEAALLIALTACEDAANLETVWRRATLQVRSPTCLPKRPLSFCGQSFQNQPDIRFKNGQGLTDINPEAAGVAAGLSAAAGAAVAAAVELAALLGLAAAAEPPHCETTSFPAEMVPSSFPWAVATSDVTVESDLRGVCQ